MVSFFDTILLSHDPQIIDIIEGFIFMVIFWMTQRTAQVLQFFPVLAVNEQTAIGAVSDGDVTEDIPHVVEHPHHGRRSSEWTVIRLRR